MTQERTLKISLATVTAIAITASGAALKTYFDVQYMKEQLAKGISGERIAKIEGQLDAHEQAAGIRAQANEQRFLSLEGRVTQTEKTLNWQRNREAERAR